jgi:hypothetical protein
VTFALAFALCLSFVRPSGERAFYARLVALGGGAHIASVARDVEQVAAQAGLRPEQLGALLIGENPSLDPDAVSWNKSSRGMLQLNVRGRYYRGWRAACRAVPSTCRYSAIREGARALSDALERCRADFGCAVTVYRSGRVRRLRKVDLDVVTTARRIRVLMGGEA